MRPRRRCKSSSSAAQLRNRRLQQEEISAPLPRVGSDDRMTLCSECETFGAGPWMQARYGGTSIKSRQEVGCWARMNVLGLLLQRGASRLVVVIRPPVRPANIPPRPPVRPPVHAAGTSIVAVGSLHAIVRLDRLGQLYFHFLIGRNILRCIPCAYVRGSLGSSPVKRDSGYGTQEYHHQKRPSGLWVHLSFVLICPHLWFLRAVKFNSYHSPIWHSISINRKDRMPIIPASRAKLLIHSQCTAWPLSHTLVERSQVESIHCTRPVHAGNS
jgi:hypothetical protein